MKIEKQIPKHIDRNSTWKYQEMKELAKYAKGAVPATASRVHAADFSLSGIHLVEVCKITF